MYENIGGKIKGLAKAIFIIEAIAAVITGFVLMASDSDTFLIGLLVMIIGSIVAWVSSWFLYGFGELIDKACEIEKNTRKDNDESNQHTEAPISTNLSDTCNRENVSAPKSTPKNTAKYNCISIDSIGKKSHGTCVVCRAGNVDLEMCKIQTEIGSRTLDICQNCYQQFCDTSSNK